MQLNPGTTWNSRYEILSRIGEGGFATVYKARDEELNREVAIKFLKSSNSDDSSETSTRFLREAKVLGKLSHPNIISVYSYEFTEQGTPAIIMELLNGENLDSKIAREGALSEKAFESIFLQVIEALKHAHSFGIIHRDLSGSNIFLENLNGEIRAKVIDFGISSLIASDDASSIDRLTRTGALIGNPSFMSPEQTKGKKLDCRSDIYSLGCVMYKALCGQLPFQADSAIGILFMHQNDFPSEPQVNWQNPKAAEKSIQITKQCMEKDPDLRFQNCAELQSAFATEELTISKQLSKWKTAEEKRNRANSLSWKILLLTSFCILAGFAYFNYTNRHLQLADKPVLEKANPRTGVQRKAQAFIRDAEAHIKSGNITHAKSAIRHAISSLNKSSNLSACNPNTARTELELLDSISDLIRKIGCADSVRTNCENTKLSIEPFLLSSSDRATYYSAMAITEAYSNDQKTSLEFALRAAQSLAQLKAAEKIQELCKVLQFLFKERKTGGVNGLIISPYLQIADTYSKNISDRSLAIKQRNAISQEISRLGNSVEGEIYGLTLQLALLDKDLNLWEQAEVDFERALVLSEPVDTDYVGEYANIAENLHYIYAKLGKPEKDIENDRKIIAHYKWLEQNQPIKQKKIECRYARASAEERMEKRASKEQERK